MARLGGMGRETLLLNIQHTRLQRQVAEVRQTGEGNRYGISRVGHRSSPGSGRWYRHLWRRSPHCHRPDHCGCSLRRRWCCRSGTQGHFWALRWCQWAGGWHSPWQWGSPGWGTQCVAPSWQTQAVQASGSQRAPSGQARPSPQHWGEAAWHSQDSSCLTLPCRSLFWGERWG